MMSYPYKRIGNFLTRPVVIGFIGIYVFHAVVVQVVFIIIIIIIIINIVFFFFFFFVIISASDVKITIVDSSLLDWYSM